MNYLETLNAEQKKAVVATEGPVLIVAGAGAGKTKTLTHRILHLIHTGVAPHNILAITFTNKAAKEMRERVLHLLAESHIGEQYRTVPFVSTFHSFGVMVIKENSEILKLPRHFTIFDTSDSKKAVKDAITYIGADPKECLDKVRHIISAEKGRGVTATEYSERQAYDYTSELVKKVWLRYEHILAKEKALDFDDLLLKTLLLIEKNEAVREKYQKRFLYIHIDEYQDTNKVQNRIVELLAEKHQNICVVGDTDQNIYSWRGAEIKNMLHFEKTYPKVQTIFLEQNYRSTKTILAVANVVIEKNSIRIPKKLFTENIDGEQISIFEARDETDEAHFIAMKAKSLIEQGVPADEIAVLYRANFQSRVLEEAFLAHNTPYQMLGTKFFERKEIKDVLSYIRASLNTDGTTDIARIINTPPRGIGKVTLDKIEKGLFDELPSSTRAKIDGFTSMLREFETILKTQKPHEAIKYIIDRSGIERSYKTGNEEDTERLENIMELVTLATRYADYPAEEAIDIFLTDATLASDQDSLDGSKSGVKLMTVHSSKGLEFDSVFVCGLEEDLFPHKKLSGDKKTKEEAEEERRLFYVAITRARKKLFLTFANMRTIFGNREVSFPSEFVSDVPEEYTQKETYTNINAPKSFFSIDF